MKIGQGDTQQKSRLGLFATVACLGLIALSLTGGDVLGQGAAKAKKKGKSKKAAVTAQKGANAAKAGVLPPPAITVLIKNSSETFGDLEHIFGLAGAPAQAKTLTDTIDLFLKGVSRNKPLSLQAYAAGPDLKYVVALPIADAKTLKEFLKNCNDVDLENRPVSGVPDLYSIGGLIEAGAYLKYDPKLLYAVMAEWREEVDAYKGLPPAALLDTDDVVILVESTASQAVERKTTFARARKESVDALKRGPKETQTAFDLRKQALINQLDEFERFFAEGEKIRIGWTTDAPANKANLSVTLKALAGTGLEASVRLIGTHPGEFGGIPAEGAVVRGNINFPLDDLRKKQFENYIKLTKAAIEEQVDSNDKLTAAEKDSGRQLAEIGQEIANGVAKTGVLNAFIRVYPAGTGKYTTVAGGKVDDTSKFVDLLKAAAERLGGPDRFQQDVDSEGDVKIHTLSLAAYQKDYPEIIADDGKMYIGLAGKKLWLAGGEGALAKLKEAIQANAKETPSSTGPAIEFEGNVAPWLAIYDRRMDKKGDKALRTQALEAFAAGGKDTWGMTLVRDGDVVKLAVRFDEGILRMTGKVGAKFVKESLE